MKRRLRQPTPYSILMLILVLVACRLIETGNQRQTDTPTAFRLGFAATATYEPVPTETVAIEVFSLSPSQLAVPEDILSEMYLFPGGGTTRHEGPADCAGRDYAEPTLIVDPLEYWELPGEVYVTACGWQSDELVEITLVFPSGDSMSESTRITRLKQDDGTSLESGAVFLYELDSQDPAGVYIVIFEGESGRLEHSFDVAAPAGPRLHEYPWERRLVLSNFRPNERVRLFAYDAPKDYQGLVNLIAWHECSVGSDGQLTVRIEGGQGQGHWPVGHFIVLGDVSGEVEPFDPQPYLLESVQKVNCVVAATDGKPVYMTEEYFAESRVIKQVALGTRMKVSGSQRARDGLRWHVHLADGTEGWVADGDVKRVID